MTGMPAARASLTTWTRLPGSGLVVTIASALAAIAARIASCCEATSPLWNDVFTELTRRRLADHLDELSDRLTPGQVFDEMLSYSRAGGGTFCNHPPAKPGAFEM